MAQEHAPAHAHMQHTSPWPMPLGVGIGLVTFAFAFFIKQMDTVAWLVLAIGGALALVGLSGWVRELTREDIREIKTRQEEEYHHIGWWGMITFIGSEVFLFGTLFSSYFVLRWHSYTFTNDPLNFFRLNGEVLNVMGLIPALNTLYLVSSSVTVHFSEIALRRGNFRLFQLLLGITILLGFIFVGGQVYEYVKFVTEEGFTMQASPYGGIFFSLTGLHGLHVTGGALFLLYVFIGSFLKQIDKEKHVVLSAASIYWHFVDVVWLFLMTVIYLRLI